MLVTDIRSHLLSRGLDPQKYPVCLDELNCIATFLLFNLTGQLVGYQQYNPNGTKQIRNDEKHRDQLKYFTFAGEEGDSFRPGKKRLVTWGIESLSLRPDVVFIVEGVFDAVKIHNVGYPALATISNDPKHLRGFLRSLGREIIAVCDRDDAGKRLAGHANRSVLVPEPFHDVGDMPEPDVARMVAGLSLVAQDDV